MNYNM